MPTSQSSNGMSMLLGNQQSHQMQNGHQRLQNLQSTASVILRNSFSYPLSNCQNGNGKYNIATANPLLAEKLAASPGTIKQEPISNDYMGQSLGYDSPVMQRIGDISNIPKNHNKGKKIVFLIQLVLLFLNDIYDFFF